MKHLTLASIATIIISSSTLIGPTALGATASEGWHSVFTHAPITNPKILYHDATHHITSKLSPPFQVLGTWMKNGQKSPSHPPTSYTTQWVASSTNSNGATENQYVTTGFVSGNTMTYDGSGSLSGTSWDSTYGVEAYATIYWDKYTVNGSTETKLTKVTGGWHTYDPTEYVRNPRINYGATGWTSQGVYQQQASDGNNPFPSLTFSYTPPSWWVPISMSSTTYTPRIFGTHTTATILRGTSSWGMSLTVEYN